MVYRRKIKNLKIFSDGSILFNVSTYKLKENIEIVEKDFKNLQGNSNIQISDKKSISYRKNIFK